MSLRRLILRSFQSPGDVTMLTATVRDLHLAHPGQFETDVRTAADALWLNNPHITKLSEGQPRIEFIEMHYPLIHESNQRPYHFIHGYTQYLEQHLGVKIPVTRFSGDIHLSADEKHSPPPGAELGIGEHFWIMMAGGKYDFTAKWWNPASYQKVVDHFRGKIQFVQCGEQGHWHPPLTGVVNLIGKTDTRSFVRLVHHADGVVCPVTFAMHLAAAVETRPGRPQHRPCIVIAGGREPPHWEAYPHHQFLSTVGALPCCADGGCWKSRCQPVGDGDSKDRHDTCVDPVQIQPDLRIARCLDLITPEQVIERIELYFRGGVLKFHTNAECGVRNAELKTGPPLAIPNSELPTPNSPDSQVPPSDETMNVLINFRHGLGDAIQLSIILKHLKKHRPNWNVDVATLVGKHTAFGGLCRRIFILEREFPPCCEYRERFTLDWHECHAVYPDSPSTKAERCLREEFGIIPEPELCAYSIEVGDEARRLAREYLERVCAGSSALPTLNSELKYPVVLIHYEGNTSADMKNIPTEIIRRLCDDIIEMGFVPVILDWDYRTPLADGVRIHCPDQRAELWHRSGTGDAESLAALIELSSLMVGVDSGPLHVAGATSTPTLGVWTRHHPLHYFSHADNVTHLVPRNHLELLRGDREAGEKYFAGHYQSQVYDDLDAGLRAAVRSRLTKGELPSAAAPATNGQVEHNLSVSDNLTFSHDFWIRAEMAEQDLVVVQDVAERDAYRIDEIPMEAPFVIDVGAHIGTFSRRLHRRNPLARIIAVECCPENLNVLRKNIGDIATVVAGAVSYETDVSLLNAVYKDCRSTGGSIVVRRGELEGRAAAAKAHALANQNSNGSVVVGDESAHGEIPASDDLPCSPFELSPVRLDEYWADFRPLQTITLEDLMEQHGFDHIDILKLDCEGSEYSILGKTPSLERIGLIVGEYHGRERFDKLVAERFADWNLRIIKDGEFGTFWLQNPTFKSQNVRIKQQITTGGNGRIDHFVYEVNGIDAATQPPSAVASPPPHSELRIPHSPLPPLAPPGSRGTVSVSFYHGLGDCANFAHLISLYVRRGYRVEVECTPDKALLFEAAGAVVVPHGRDPHPWGYPPGATHLGQGRYWQGSKIANNLSLAPFPDIGTAEELWDELCATAIDISLKLSQSAFEQVAGWFAELPRPIVLLHTKGNTAQERKSLPDTTTTEFYRALLDRYDGSLVLLDWDNRVPRLASYRVRHLDDLGPCSTEVMLAMMAASDLMIGVDSGPLHACRFTDTPSVGIWKPGHYPSTYAIPRRQQLNIVLAEHTRQWNRYKRIPWNIIEHSGSAFEADRLADSCVQMLQPPRYLPHVEMAADVQMQQFVREWCRGRILAQATAYPDRNRSFDLLFQELSRRFEKPQIVETGTIRGEEDWDGAGFFTYLAGAYVSRHGGRLDSVDLLPINCEFARNSTQVFGSSVTINEADSISFLENFPRPIDLLYLDSLDTTEPGHAEHAEREFAAARSRLHERSLIVIDDTPWQAGAWIGKGARLVPALLAEGWKILYAGWQVVLERGAS